jgi:3-oxoacyl-[acyl-carrier protein] reductase
MNKLVLITGATRGIGLAATKIYKSNGYTVIGTGTTSYTSNLCDSYYQCDFSSLEEIEDFCQKIINLPISILVNNAGINIINSFCEINPKDFLKLQQINLYAPFRIAQTVIPNMLKNNWGRIVNLSSVWGKLSKPGAANYSASKFGIDGLTVSIANEFSKNGILVNCVSPGFIDTDMTWKNLGKAGIDKILERVPAGRLAKTDEVAKLIYMLGSEENTFITGQNVSIDGGFTRA